MMADICEFCGEPLPQGCYGDGADYAKCALSKDWTETREDKVGRKLLVDITDRRGWRQEWGQFDYEIRGEIRRTLGKIAIKAVQEADDGS